MAKPTGTSTDHIEPTTTPGKELSRELEDINCIPLGWFVWMVAFTASIAGLLFGYALPRVLLLEIAHRNLDMTQALSLQYWSILETIWTDGTNAQREVDDHLPVLGWCLLWGHLRWSDSRQGMKLPVLGTLLRHMLIQAQ